jgi:hypothetical protein
MSTGIAIISTIRKWFLLHSANAFFFLNKMALTLQGSPNI